MLMYQDNQQATMVKDGTTIEMVDLQPLTEDKIQAHVQAMSIHLSSPVSGSA